MRLPWQAEFGRNRDAADIMTNTFVNLPEHGAAVEMVKVDPV